MDSSRNADAIREYRAGLQLDPTNADALSQPQESSILRERKTDEPEANSGRNQAKLLTAGTGSMILYGVLSARGLGRILWQKGHPAAMVPDRGESASRT